MPHFKLVTADWHESIAQNTPISVGKLVHFGERWEVTTITGTFMDCILALFGFFRPKSS